MSIKMATWIHGNGAMNEFPPRSERRMASASLFGGVDLTFNWFHFPITTPVIIDDKRPRLTRVMVLYRMRFCAVEKVQVRSGGERIADFSVIQESGRARTNAEVMRDQFVERKTMFTIDPNISNAEIRQGLSISVKVNFDSVQTINSPPGSSNFIDAMRSIGTIEFFSAGADWTMPP